MAKDLTFKIKASAEWAEREVKRLQATGQTAAHILEQDFERLGIRSTVAIEAQRAAYVSVYERIKNSGVATWQEIQAAHTAMTAKIAALDAVLDPVAAKLARADEEILAMAGRGEAAVDRLSNSFQQLGIRSTASIQEERAAAVAAYQQIEASGVATWQEIQTAHAAMVARVKALDLEAQFGRGSAGAKTLRQNLDDVGSSLDRLKPGVVSLVGSLAVFYAGGKLAEGFRAGLQSVDDFDQAIVKTASLITTLQKGGDIAANYRAAKEYAQGLNDQLMMIDSRTVLNLTNLQDITEEMVKQGVVLDYSNKAQLEGFTNIANAGAVYSENGKKEAQLRQEIAALLRGEVNQNSQLASMLQKTVDGPLSKYVEQWKQSGTFIEEIGGRLKGFGPAADDLSKSWGAVKSSFETSMTLVLRAGFTDIVKDIAGWLGKINDYLKTHREEVGGKIREGWEKAKELMSGAATVAKLIYENFEPFAALLIGGAVIGGVTRLISVFGTLRDIVISTRAAMVGMGMISAGAGAAGAAVAATAGVAGAATVGGAVAAGTGAGLLGLGLGYAAQPLVRWADRKLYQSFGINLTGEAMYNEAEARNQEADQRWKAYQAKLENWRGLLKGKVPSLNLGESPEQLKEMQDLREKDLAAFRAGQESMTATAKQQSDVRLSILQANYGAGLVSTRDFYEAEKAAALEAAQAKFENAAAYLRKEQELLEFIAAKKGTDSPEYQSELVKNKKAVAEMQSAQLEYAKTYLEGEQKMTDALRRREEEYAKLAASTLDAAAEYVEAERQKQAMDDKSIDMLRLKKEAQEGVAGAVEALAAIERNRAYALASAQVKEQEHARQYATDISKMREELELLNGADEELLKSEGSLRDGREKLLQLQERLALAWAQGDRVAIAGLNQKIQLQSQLNAKLQQTNTFLEQQKVLAGEIVGFNNGRAIGANEGGAFNNGQAVGLYQSPGAKPQAAGTNYWGEKVDAAGNVINKFGMPNYVSIGSPFLGSYATGTRYIDKTGPYLLHQGETVRNARETRQDLGAGMSVTFGDVQFILPNVTNQSNATNLAREALPELMRLMQTRFRKAA